MLRGAKKRASVCLLLMYVTHRRLDSMEYSKLASDAEKTVVLGAVLDTVRGGGLLSVGR